MALLVGFVTGCPRGNNIKNVKLSRDYYRLGHSFLGKKQPGLAKVELIKAIKFNDKNKDAHELLGVIYFLEGVHATNYIDRKQCIKGDAAQEQLKEANITFRKAKGHFDRVVELADDEGKIASEALNYMANISMHFGRYDEAIANAEKAQSNIMYGKPSATLCVKGQAYFKKGDYIKAARDLRQALFHEPKFCLAHYWLAKVLYAQKKYDQVVTQLESLVKGKEQCPLQEVYYLLGLAYMKTQKNEEAKKQFQQCVTRNSKSCVGVECARYAQLI